MLPSLSNYSKLTDPFECEVVEKEIETLLKKGVISECLHEPGEVISPVFTRAKKDGSHRMILNLKKLNTEVSYHHFKMETLQVALTLIRKDCFMASVDLKDAYYSVAIQKEFRKYLRFEWKEKLFEYTALPNGLSLAPRLFTKLLKPVFAALRLKGHVSTAFIDDSLLLGSSQEACTQNIIHTIHLLQQLGFIIHPHKSVLQPAKQITYLGVIIDSERMTVTLSEDRKVSLKLCCQHLIKKELNIIRDVAQCISKLVASFVAVKYGPLFYRNLEQDKSNALKQNKGDFDQLMRLSAKAKTELLWWIEQIDTTFNDITTPDLDISVSSDASSIGW
jgi:hypothetical protein